MSVKTYYLHELAERIEKLEAEVAELKAVRSAKADPGAGGAPAQKVIWPLFYSNGQPVDGVSLDWNCRTLISTGETVTVEEPADGPTPDRALIPQLVAKVQWTTQPAEPTWLPEIKRPAQTRRYRITTDADGRAKLEPLDA